MTYLGYYSDNPKTPVAARIAAGAQAYQDKFGEPPRVVLVSEADAAGLAVEGVVVLVKAWVRKSNYLFGMGDC